MSEPLDATPSERRPDSFPAGLDVITFVMSPSHDKFELDALRKFFDEDDAESSDTKDEHTTGFIVVAPERGASGDYHVHLSWTVTKEAVELTVGFYPQAIPHADDETAPFAEDVMKWLGGFFKYDSAHSVVTCAFTYPLEKRQSRFLLPLKLELGTVEAEIDGISLRLTAKPEGVLGVRLLQGREKWFVDAIGETRVVFDAFTPYETAHAVARALALILLEERAP